MIKWGISCSKEGSSSNGPRILLAGHIDEIGFIVTGISPLGFISFRQLGGWYDQVLLGQRVQVMSNKGMLSLGHRLQTSAPHGSGGDEEGGGQG